MRSGNYEVCLLYCVVLLFSQILPTQDANGNESSISDTNIVSQLTENIPENFPRFTFVNHPEQAGLLS
ncbi:MAG: hypothetical protein JSU94_16765, partial [Phycisphaerales bacterium]